MNVQEFESHVAGAVNSALRNNIHPSIVVTVLEGTKLDVLLMMKNVAAQQRREEQAKKNGEGTKIIIPETGFDPRG